MKSTLTLTRMLIPASFTLEPLDGKIFEGFTTGQQWNGWACPLFTHDQAAYIVNAWHDRGFKADYDVAGDMFRFAPIDQQGNPDPDLSDEEDAEQFGSMEIDGKILYRVGAGAWIWEIA